MEERARRSPLRFLAPVALVVFALAFLVVLVSADGGDSGDSGDSGSSTRTEQGDRTERARTREARQTRESELPDRVYVVKAGDTLAGIAQQVGITVERLMELNPELDPQALVSGQEIKLRE